MYKTQEACGIARDLTHGKTSLLDISLSIKSMKAVSIICVFNRKEPQSKQVNESRLSEKNENGFFLWHLER